MLIVKFIKQKIDNLRNRQPDLLKSIELADPSFTDEQKGIVAGLIIEYVLKSGGNATIFEDNLYEQLEKEELDDF